jgi:fatty acid-binding protein DegV
MTVSEIFDNSFEIRNSYAMYFACDSLEQINNNNLLDSNLVVGTSLNIKPILTTDIDGNIELVDKVIGKKKVINK